MEIRGNLTGAVYDPHGKVQYTLGGSYTSSITASKTSSGSAFSTAGNGSARTIFTSAPLPDDAELQYSMTSIAITLNAPVPGACLTSYLPNDAMHAVRGSDPVCRGLQYPGVLWVLALSNCHACRVITAANLSCMPRYIAGGSDHVQCNCELCACGMPPAWPRATMGMQ